MRWRRTGATVATAESCTGGHAVRSDLRLCPAQARCFGYGACTYANDIRKRVLGVAARNAGGSMAPSRPRRPPRWRRACAAPPGRTSAWASQALPGRAAARRKSPWDLVYVAAASADTVYVQKLVITGRTREVVRSVQHAARAGDGAPPGAGPAAAGLHGLPGGGAGPSDAERHACAGRIAPACSIPEPPEPA